MTEEKYHYHWTTIVMNIVLFPVALLVHIVFLPVGLVGGLMARIFPDRHQDDGE